MKKIKCTSHACRQKIIAEQDEDGNIFVMCRWCKEKIKIEVRVPREPRPSRSKALILSPTMTA